MIEGETPWQSYLSDTLSTLQPIRKRIRSAAESELPKIVNMVSTVVLLPQGKGYRLPLHAIARALQCAQYAPVMFAANIIKFRDSTGDCTALVFASGKVVVVSCQTPYHTLYMSQFTRFIIEQVQCAMLRDDGSVNPCGSLLGRTVFEDCCIHNIVGHAKFRCRIDLQAMCDASPSACKWLPDLFPGLKCAMWLTNSGMCECQRIKCVCSVKVLVFDTGKIVITGGRSIHDINNIFYRIKAIIPSFRTQAPGVHDSSNNKRYVIPKADRFYARLSTMLVPSGFTMKDVDSVIPAELDEAEALATLFSHQLNFPAATAPTTTTQANTHLTPLMQLADAGRVEDVKFLLACEPKAAAQRDENGKTTWQRLKQIPKSQRTVEHKMIMDVLIALE
jgi:TATA-box binding protein (TBP) (component of TFIID and TFIIIB)